MRRWKNFALPLALLFVLAACQNKASDNKNPAPPPRDDDTAEMTLYECGGYQIALPAEYTGQLIVDGEPAFESTANERFLLSVSEKASVEAAEADFGSGAGFGYLFGLAVVDQAGLEQFLCMDYPGASVFATDGEQYYIYTEPTDVQFYRPGGEMDTEGEAWRAWEALRGIGPQVRDDFLERNQLQSFHTQDYMDRLAAEDGNHVCVKYYPYLRKDGDTRIYDQLLVWQPVRQGEGGVWAVDQWFDVYGNQNLYFPDSGKPSAEYYAQLQEACDSGKHGEYLTPEGAAAAFVLDYFGNEADADSFVQAELDRGYMERNEGLEQLALDVMAERAISGRELLERVGAAAADNWGVLGRNMYGSDWFTPLMEAVSSAAVGEGQRFRDESVMRFYLASEGALTDFHTPLSGILQAQKQADPESYEAALESFTEEEQSVLLGAAIPICSLPRSAGIPEKVEPAESPES